MSDLTSLNYLYLQDNQISDITPIVENEGIDANDIVLIQDNPLNCDDTSTQENLATLLTREVALVHNCD